MNKSNGDIRLRGHHLGLVYDLVALMFGRTISFELALGQYFRSLLYMFYPIATIDKAKYIAVKLFLDKDSKIVIVNGLDEVCNSG